MPIYRYVNKKFFKKWNGAMAYVLGFLFADGNVVITNRGTHYFALHSLDRLLLRSIASVMGATQKVTKRNKRSGTVYRLQIGSREMVGDLFLLGLTVGKAKRMRLPKIPPVFFSDFLRGYFDGDGNVWKGVAHRNRKTHTETISVAFTSASKGFLQDLHRILQKRGIVGGSLYTPLDKNFSRLSFSKNDSLNLYEIMYNTGAVNNLYLQRKKRVFERFLKMRT